MFPPEPRRTEEKRTICPSAAPSARARIVMASPVVAVVVIVAFDTLTSASACSTTDAADSVPETVTVVPFARSVMPGSESAPPMSTAPYWTKRVPGA
jgi:hypothetical protein